jgi:hypothetical protein
MRLATLSLLAAVAGCTANTPTFKIPSIGQADPSSVPDEAVENPLRPPYDPNQTAKVTYDRDTGTFTLTNRCNRTIWYDGRPREGPVPEYQRLTPGGWVVTWVDGCGTDSGWLPLAPGQSVSLGRFREELLAKGYQEAREFVRQGGNLNAVPGRVGIVVTCDRTGAGVTVYSEGVDLPR